MSRSFVATVIIALLSAGLGTATPASAAPLYPQEWAHAFDGWNRSSSPVIADIDADGQNEIVVGHQDSLLRAYEADGTLKWQTAAVPGLNAGCGAQSSGTAIDSSPAVADPEEDLASTVDPFIGTGGHGHTFPGATTPFGMVQLSPDTRLTGWDGCGGYHYSDNLTFYFSGLNLTEETVHVYGLTEQQTLQAVQGGPRYDFGLRYNFF